MITPLGLRVSLFVLALAMSAGFVRAEPQRIRVRFAEISGFSVFNPASPFGVKLNYLTDLEVDNQLKLMELAGVGQLLGSEVSGIQSADPFEDKLSYLPDGEVIALSPDTPAKVSVTAIKYSASKSGTENEVSISVGGHVQEFRTRNLGGELELLQIASEDAVISLKATISRTTFVGFVEYGGQQVVVSGQTAVKVPTGFYQPIFSTDTQEETLSIKPGVTTILRMDWTAREHRHQLAMVDVPQEGTVFVPREGWRPHALLILLSSAE